MEGGAKLGGVKCAAQSSLRNFSHAHILECKYIVPTSGMFLEVFENGPGFVFFFISTIINKEKNKSVLKNVCHFQSSEISPIEFVNGSVYVDLQLSFP